MSKYRNILKIKSFIIFCLKGFSLINLAIIVQQSKIYVLVYSEKQKHNLLQLTAFIYKFIGYDFK